MREIICGGDIPRQFSRICQAHGCKRVLLVCGASFYSSALHVAFEKTLEEGGIRLVHFSGFSPNPEVSAVEAGLDRFRAGGCDFILAAGGGSAMDVAKCIKLFCAVEDTRNLLEQEIVPNQIPLAVLPTTAGSGSEATHFAVCYRGEEKLSISHESAKPGYVLLEPETLRTLPDYQKKSAMLDAFCHAVESYWSVNATPQSQGYSARAIGLIRRHRRRYLDNDPESLAGMMTAAYLAGKAIDLAQTTAAHAMSYRLTKRFGLAHGHGVAICLPALWRFARLHPEQWVHPRGAAYLRRTMDELQTLVSGETGEDVSDTLARWLQELGLVAPDDPGEEELSFLAGTVDPDRLRNHPIALSEPQRKALYHAIFKEK